MKKLKHFIKDKIMLPVKQALIKSKNFDNDLIIIKMDGGISSQICFYCIGKYFINRGFKVKYDLSWFDECGMDLNNKFPRNFDLLKTFPSIVFETATKEETNHYRKYFKLSSNNFEKQKAPLYLGKYYNYGLAVQESYKYLIEKFEPELDETNSEWLKKIKSSKSCGIHVRRGDLSQTVNAYGAAASSKYFINAINYINEKNSACKFFFFSDEVDWIKEELVPSMKDIDYQIIDCNGSDKGYLDLYLISNCEHFITSTGSFGKVGAILSHNQKSTITVNENDNNLEILKILNSFEIVKFGNK